MKVAQLFIIVLPLFCVNTFGYNLEFDYNFIYDGSTLDCDESFEVDISELINNCDNDLYIESIEISNPSTNHINIKSISPSSYILNSTLLKNYKLTPQTKWTFTVQTEGEASIGDYTNINFGVRVRYRNDGSGVSRTVSKTIRYDCPSTQVIYDGYVELDYFNVEENVTIPSDQSSITITAEADYDEEGNNPGDCDIEKTRFFLDGKEISEKSGGGAHSKDITFSSAGQYELKFKAYYSGCDGESGTSEYTTKTIKVTNEIVEDGALHIEASSINSSYSIPEDQNNISIPITWNVTVQGSNPGECNLAKVTISRVNTLSGIQTSLFSTTAYTKGTHFDNVSEGSYYYTIDAIPNNCADNSIKTFNTETFEVTKEINWINILSINSIQYSKDAYPYNELGINEILLSLIVNNNGTSNVSDYDLYAKISGTNKNIDVEKLYDSEIKNGTNLIYIKLTNIEQGFENSNLEVGFENIQGAKVSNIIHTYDNISFQFSLNSKNQKFIFDRDAYSFPNKKYSLLDWIKWFEIEVPSINDKDLRLISLTMLGDFLCYGFSSSAGNYYWDESKKPSNLKGTKTYDMKVSNSEVINNILRYYYTQRFNDMSRNWNDTPKNIFQNIYNSLKIKNEPVLVNLGHQDAKSGKWTGHSILGVSVFKTPNQRGFIRCWDNMADNNDKTIPKQSFKTIEINLELDKFDDSFYNFLCYEELPTILPIPNTYESIIENQEKHLTEGNLKIIKIEMEELRSVHNGSMEFNIHKDSSFIILSNLFTSDSCGVFCIFINSDNELTLTEYKNVRASGNLKLSKQNDTLFFDENIDGIYEKFILPSNDETNLSKLHITDSKLRTLIINGQKIKINISTPKAKVEIFDLRGRVAYKNTITLNKTIDINHKLSKGIYIIRINNLNRKFIQVR